MAALESQELAMLIHLSCAPLLAFMQKDKATTEISSEYTDYSVVFLFDLAMELSENTGINEYVIELVESKQPPYRSIYSLSQVELETSKT